MKRCFDVLLLILAAIVLCCPMGFLVVFVRISSTGPALYWSDRIGRNNIVFRMPKFRTMRSGTPAVATHLLANPHSLTYKIFLLFYPSIFSIPTPLLYTFSNLYDY